MKNILSISIIFLTISNLFAQKHILNQVSDSKNRLKATIYAPLSISTIQTLSNHFVTNNSVIQFDVNQAILNQIEIAKPALLNFSIPTTNNSSIILELIPNNIFGESYKVLDATNQEVDFSKGVYYKGVIKGDDNSLVSISIVNGEISGVISNEKGNFILGKLKNNSNYIYYK